MILEIVENIANYSSKLVNIVRSDGKIDSISLKNTFLNNFDVFN